MALYDGNIDTAEITRFEAVSSRWWDRRGAFRALHDINGSRVGYIAERAELKGRKTLDVGCGGGLLSESLAARGAVVTGIDMAAGSLAVARAHMSAMGYAIDYRRTTVEAMAADHGGGFEVVTCMELLEHVPDPGSVVAACSRLSTPGGHLFFATLNRNPWSFLLAIVAAEYLLDLVPRGTHRYDRFIKPRELIRWARAAGLAAADVSGLHYNPLLRTCRIGGGVHVNYLAHFQRRG